MNKAALRIKSGIDFPSFPGRVRNAADALTAVQKEGGKLLCGGGRAEMQGELKGGHFAVPAIVRAKNEYKTVQEETFAPILYIIPFKDFDDAVAQQNGVPQGLTSAIFTRDIRKGERFPFAIDSGVGCDGGIANININININIGTFGGEKDTGGGRESGSDAWKSYIPAIPVPQSAVWHETSQGRRESIMRASHWGRLLIRCARSVH